MTQQERSERHDIIRKEVQHLTEKDWKLSSQINAYILGLGSATGSMFTARNDKLTATISRSLLWMDQCRFDEPLRVLTSCPFSYFSKCTEI